MGYFVEQRLLGAGGVGKSGSRPCKIHEEAIIIISLRSDGSSEQSSSNGNVTKWSNSIERDTNRKIKGILRFLTLANGGIELSSAEIGKI